MHSRIQNLHKHPEKISSEIIRSLIVIPIKFYVYFIRTFPVRVSGEATSSPAKTADFVQDELISSGI